MLHSLHVNFSSVLVEVTAVLDAYVSGGNLNAKYTFSQFHFHFGAEDDRGSEHTVDGDRWVKEQHLNGPTTRNSHI